MQLLRELSFVRTQDLRSESLANYDGKRVNSRNWQYPCGLHQLSKASKWADILAVLQRWSDKSCNWTKSSFASSGFAQKLGSKIQWLFHELRNAKNPCFWGYIFARRQKQCFQFSNSTKYLYIKNEIPWLFHDLCHFFLKSIIFSGLENAFSNSMTFHDRMNPVPVVYTKPTNRTSLFQSKLQRIYQEEI